MLIHEPSQSLLLNSRDPKKIKLWIPKAKIGDFAGHNVAVRHGIDEVKVLKNLGIKGLTSPIRYYYSWPGIYKPFDHQRATAEFLTLNRRAFVLSDPGTAKTAPALWAADYLLEQGKINRVLIICPLSCVNSVWKKDIFKILMHRSATVIHGGKEKRLNAIKCKVEFYIINHEGVAIMLRELDRLNPQLIIVDEGSFYRNHGTGKWKALKAAIKPKQMVWWISGTPCPNAPTDAWAQAKIMNVKNCPEYFGSFRRQTMIQVSQFKWAPAVGGYQKAFELLQPAIRFLKSECMDLPPVMFESRDVALSDEQRLMVKSMVKDMTIELKQKGKSITAVHAADKLGKLRQILCGSVKDPVTGEYVDIDYTPRLKVLKECIETAGAKVIVICPFKGSLRRVAEDLKKEYTVGAINGDVSIKQRDRIIQQFKETPDPHVLVCHPKVMSHGLNLTEADTLIFFAPIFSPDEFIQVMERFNRPGQTQKMTIYNLSASRLEKEIYTLVDEKKRGQDELLNLFKLATETMK